MKQSAEQQLPVRETVKTANISINKAAALAAVFGLAASSLIFPASTLAQDKIISDPDTPVSNTQSPADTMPPDANQDRQGQGTSGHQPSDPGANTGHDTGMTKEEHERLLKNRLNNWLSDENKQRIEWRIQDGGASVGVNSSDNAQEIGQRVELDSAEERTSISLTSESRQQIVSVYADGENFVLEQEAQDTLPAAKVRTKLPVIYDEAVGELSVTISNGVVTINHLPSAIFERVMSKGLIDEVVQAELVESSDTKNAVYRINGRRQVKLFYLFPISAEVSVDMNSTTGEQVSVSQPWYLNFFGLLFG